MFENEPLTDFSFPEVRAEFARALESFEAKRAANAWVARPIIGGEHVSTEHRVVRLDPSDPTRAVGTVEYASERDAARALQVLREGRSAWEETNASRRAEILHALASAMAAEKFELSALIVREAGKPWKEADADVAEAIDFCRYYADAMVRLSKPIPTSDVPGEENHYLYQSRGVAVVIAPWNFPLAIACGMVVAALVAGNSVVLKPAEQSSLIAFRFAELAFLSGVPGNALAFLPGEGESVGRFLVESPDVDLICFTGSKAVGLEIIRSAAEVKEGQRNIKRVIAELGGKNAIIVDEDADLDEAVKGIMYSAFGFAGQKCSACSRVIAVGTAYEPLVERLAEAASDLIIGRASDPGTFVGPVIDRESQQRIRSTIDRGAAEAKVAFVGEVPVDAPADGYYVAPAIFRDVSPQSSLWREEIFGPVIACAPARTVDEAIALAVDSPYALTGGFFSRSPQNVEKARRDFRVGNLYINRGCTGALVGRQPFGGFRMSGVGSKAGGPDYLLQFLEPRAICENTMRRGFAPEAEQAAG